MRRRGNRQPVLADELPMAVESGHDLGLNTAQESGVELPLELGAERQSQPVVELPAGRAQH